MTLNFIDCEQGSETWAAERCGKVTASRCADVLAKIKKGEASDRRKYREEILAEILTGQPASHYVSPEMQWGREQEPFARAAYEIQCNATVETYGFVLHPSLPRFGASPDGLVGNDGMIQIKCPNTSTHLNSILANAIPPEHIPQMLAEMACAGRQWNDFVSFDPRLPQHLQLFIKRLPRDDKLIAELEAEVMKFTAEIDETLARLPQSGRPQPIVELLDNAPEVETPPVLSSIPFILESKPTLHSKPKIDELDPKTGKMKYANYEEYADAKDQWLQQDTLRLFLEMIYNGKGPTR